ncbi:MAG: ABC-type amino acid transport substrate-binding protein, partial [Shewanella sp.]
MKYNAYVLLAVLSVFFTTAVFSAAKDGVQPLVISMSDDSYPYQYVDENGVANGLLVDFWRQWSRLNQQKVVFRPANWQQSLDSVEQSTADIHIGMAKTVARLKVFDFDQAISKVNGYLYINKALTNANTLEKLIPYKIGVVKGSAHIDVLLEKQPKLTFAYY